MNFIQKLFKRRKVDEPMNSTLNISVVIPRFFKVVFYILLIILSVNFGKFLGYVIFKFIMWLGVLPYLEKFFGWFVW